VPVPVESFRPGQAVPDDLAAWVAVFSAGQSELSGSSTDPTELAQRLVAADAAGRSRWAARLGPRGRIVGAAELAPQPHDPRIGFVRLFVAPPFRRRGVGSALLTAVRSGASGTGIDRLQATVLAGPAAGSFTRGMRVVLRLVRQHQALDNAAALRRCRDLATVAHPGYALLHWTGPAPEIWAPSFGTVLGHVLDAPGAALQMPERQWDTAAVRVWESGMTAGGHQLVVAAAAHLPSGGVVAATVTTVPAAGGPVADQHDTAVVPEHRRHGLARWIKAAQTLRIHQDFPHVRQVTATVNQQNLPMISVNHAVGYDRGIERLLVETPVLT
jgi:GNAT superfamily N-acetyltransferase